MGMRTCGAVPISGAPARLTELADDVVGQGTEKVLTKNGTSFVALVDARRRDHYHSLEQEHAALILLDEATIGLQQVLAGEVLSSDSLMQALSA